MDPASAGPVPRLRTDWLLWAFLLEFFPLSPPGLLSLVWVLTSAPLPLVLSLSFPLPERLLPLYPRLLFPRVQPLVFSSKNKN